MTPSATSTPTKSLVPASEITAAGGTALPVKYADWVQVADGHVWTTVGTEVAQQLDAITGAELTSVPLEGQVCTAMDQGFDALGPGDRHRRGQDRPREQQRDRPLLPAAGSGSVAADASAAWISAHDEDLVYRLPLN